MGISSMYSKLPNLVIAFHGCDQSTYENVIFNRQELKASENTYDWLGHGISFWEQNIQRALEWGKKRYGCNAAVIGAIIDLGFCLNLTDSASISYLKTGYELLKTQCEIDKQAFPINRPSKVTEDILLRDLDCSVIQQIQQFYSNYDTKPAFDSVRGVFIEGISAFPGSEIMEKTHIQLCICNPNCIKGYFPPRIENPDYPLP